MAVRFGDQGSGLDVVVALSSFATVTERIALGAGVTNDGRRALRELAGARHIVFNPAVPPEEVPDQLRLLAQLRAESGDPS